MQKFLKKCLFFGQNEKNFFFEINWPLVKSMPIAVTTMLATPIFSLLFFLKKVTVWNKSSDTAFQIHIINLFFAGHTA